MLPVFENIKARRKELKLSQEELAAALGYKDRSAIAKIEHGLVDLPQSKVAAFAKALSTTPEWLMGWNTKKKNLAVRVPIYGRVVAGVPLEAIEDINGYEEIRPELAATGKYFALKVTGRSMEPMILADDTVIVRQQTTIEDGEIAIVLVNGDEATVKQIRKSQDGITLVGYNTQVFPPKFFSNKDIEQLPVQIIGKVIEIRRELP